MLYQPPPNLYWCTSHRRLAEDVDQNGQHCCKRNLPGILLPCHAVEYTLNMAEINRLAQGSAKDNMRLMSSLVIGDNDTGPHTLPVIYRRKCTSS